MVIALLSALAAALELVNGLRTGNTLHFVASAAFSLAGIVRIWSAAVRDYSDKPR